MDNYSRAIRWKGRVFTINRATPEACLRDYLLKLRSLAESDPKGPRTVLVRAS